MEIENDIDLGEKIVLIVKYFYYINTYKMKGYLK